MSSTIQILFYYSNYNYMIQFLSGVFVATTTIAIAEYYFFTKVIKKFLSPQTYPVSSYETTADPNGGYRMDFYLTPEDIKRGYTKKLPPDGTSPEKLRVYVRGYHTGRHAYRVFWEIDRT